VRSNKIYLGCDYKRVNPKYESTTFQIPSSTPRFGQIGGNSLKTK